MKKIALGVITNSIKSYSPYFDFLDNAGKFGHKLTDIIIAYSHKKDENIINKLKEKVNLHLIKLNNDPEFNKQLKQLGLNKKEIKVLCYSENFEKHGLISYGKRRNCVLMKALMLYPAVDYLFFVDTDVQPFILINRAGDMKEIDFFGRHLEFLQKENVLITTSDYSGYYIIPPMNFTGLKDLLRGVQKEEAYKKIINPRKNLVISSSENRRIKRTDKILGGNHALDLQFYRELPPYFSTTYKFKRKLVLGRGEDTLMGMEIPLHNKEIIDIDTLIFHNTFSNFPREPEITKGHIQKRFYYACLGWLGRNPFFNWYLKENDLISEKEFERRKIIQKKELINGSFKLAAYLKNQKFVELPLAFSQAYNQLEKMIRKYRQTRLVWNSFLEKIGERRDSNENIVG